MLAARSSFARLLIRPISPHPPRLSRTSFLNPLHLSFISQLHETTRTMATLGATKKHKVSVIGSGNWGSTIAKLVAENTKQFPQLYEEDVHMWVFEENIEITSDSKHYDSTKPHGHGTQKLSEVINRTHENVKYLPDIALPSNVIANPDLINAVKGSTILIFVIPHQFIERTCGTLKGNIVPYARGISCIKGVDISSGGIRLLCESIGAKLGIYCGALSGANLATEIAKGKWSETTIAYDPPPMDSRQPTPEGSPTTSQVDLIAPMKTTPGPRSAWLHALPADYPPLNHDNVKHLFHRPYFHVRMISDVAGVSLGGALKNIIAVAAGWVDGMGWGDNAKSAVIRVGIGEMVKFGRRFFADSVKQETFTEESCGVADVITSCMGGRNFRCAKIAVETDTSIYEVEKTQLNGQKLQGTSTAMEVNAFLKKEGLEKEFPLFTAVYSILEGKATPDQIPSLIEQK